MITQRKFWHSLALLKFQQTLVHAAVAKFQLDFLFSFLSPKSHTLLSVCWFVQDRLCHFDRLTPSVCASDDLRSLLTSDISRYGKSPLWSSHDASRESKLLGWDLGLSLNPIYRRLYVQILFSTRASNNSILLYSTSASTWVPYSLERCRTAPWRH